MDSLMPTLAQREKLLQKLPPRPENIPLSVLLSVISQHDSSYKGLSEKELFLRAYGDKQTAQKEYLRACRNGADDLCVRSFVLMRLTRLQKCLLRKATSAC